MQGKRHDRVVEMRLCFFSGKVGDYKVPFKSTRKCRSTIYRLLETKLNRYGIHFSIENIIETLKNMEVANIEDMCYMSTYDNSKVCTALNAIWGLGLDKKYYQPKELNKKIKKISK